MTLQGHARTPTQHGRRLFALSLALCVVILAAWRRTYWRPFDDTAQESLVSFHSYGFALANEAGIFPNPIVSRDIDVTTSRILPYPHWPNGFFLAFEAVLRIFGRSETVGRSFAIFLTAAGFTLAVLALEQAGPSLYAAVPLILLSPIGRDAIPLVFVDAALCFWIGALLWLAFRLVRRPYGNWLFRVAILAALFSNHLVFPYVLVIALLKWYETRSGKGLLWDLAALGGGGAVVMLGLTAAHASVSAGIGDLSANFRLRARHSFGSWYAMLSGELMRSINLEPVTNYLLAAAWLAVLYSRQWRTLILVPSYALFALILREYTTDHHFARLPLVFFCLLTLLAAIEVAAVLLEARTRSKLLSAGFRVAVIAAVAIRLAAAPPEYKIDRHLQIRRANFYATVEDPANAHALQVCNAFDFHSRVRLSGFRSSLGQFFLGRQVLDRIRRNAPLRTCLVDLDRHTIRDLQRGAAPVK